MVKNNLRRARSYRGMTQAALAKRAGIAQSTYSLLETGRAIPELSELNALCAALDLRPRDIYSDAFLEAVYGIGRPDQPTPKKRKFFSVKIPMELSPEIDRLVAGLGYANRTDFVVETVRHRVMKEG